MWAFNGRRVRWWVMKGLFPVPYIACYNSMQQIVFPHAPQFAMLGVPLKTLSPPLFSPLTHPFPPYLYCSQKEQFDFYYTLFFPGSWVYILKFLLIKCNSDNFLVLERFQNCMGGRSVRLLLDFPHAHSPFFVLGPDSIDLKGNVTHRREMERELNLGKQNPFMLSSCSGWGWLPRTLHYS